MLIRKSFAYGINAAGQVTGCSTTANGVSHAFLTDAVTHKMIDLGTLGGESSCGYSINKSGQVTGYSDTTRNFHHAFFTNAITRKMTDMGTMATFTGSSSEGRGIKDSGEITGFSDINTQYKRAFTYDPKTHFWIDLGTLETILDVYLLGSYGYAINNSGQVTGSAHNETTLHAFLSDGQNAMLDLGAFSDPYLKSSGYGINDGGQVTGSFVTSYDISRPEFHAFVTLDGATTDLGTLGGSTSQGNGINNKGEVVGFSDTQVDGIHAFITDANYNLKDLNWMLTNPKGWKLTVATGINDNGQISGYGLINNTYHAFLLTPVTRNLTIKIQGSGIVKDVDGFINCGTHCSANYSANAEIRIKAIPNKGSIFINWGGACSGRTKACAITMDTIKKVTATFNP